MTGWVKRRSTRTTTVLSCLSLTTTPCSVRFGISRLLRLGFRARGALLRSDGLDTSDIATDLPDPSSILELPGGPLEAQVEALLLEFQSLIVELVDGHGPKITHFHGHSSTYSAIRSMKRVLIGSLAAASPSASRASATDTPSTSNRMRPGLTRATHNSGAPLPEPMRTSSGFFETGTSGNTRIQTRPARFMLRVSARRAASICRAVIRSGSIALSPNWPNASVAALVAIPWMRPLCALRNLVRIGCSMADAFSQKPLVVGSGR